jgi:hypothetical protein
VGDYLKFSLGWVGSNGRMENGGWMGVDEEGKGAMEWSLEGEDGAV